VSYKTAAAIAVLSVAVLLAQHSAGRTGMLMSFVPSMPALAAVGMLVFTLFRHVRTVVWAGSVIGVSLVAGYGAAVIVNAVRIAMAMWLAAHPVGALISSSALHRLEGILVYFGGLVLLHEVAQRFDRNAILRGRP